ncbi:MAG: Rieske 2Fe-2S domain-containing protein [Planctomycetes bacterium]|nr:Rieske 2Fe-2S domain-containing protein [Planctomycetota bacterium]
MGIELPLADVPPGAMERIEIDGQAVMVTNVDGDIYAVSDTCTHAQISLSSGSLHGRQVMCPWHGAMFDLKTGRPTCGPAVDPLRCYRVRIENETIHIETGAD